MTRSTEYVKEGMYSLISNTTSKVRLSYSFPSRDISEYADGYLHMWIYVNDFDNIKSGQIELTSSGKWDEEEHSWEITDYLSGNGWNELYLPINAPEIKNELDLTHANYLRLYTLYNETPTEPVDMYFDDIRFTNEMN